MSQSSGKLTASRKRKPAGPSSALVGGCLISFLVLWGLLDAIVLSQTYSTSAPPATTSSPCAESKAKVLDPR